MDKASFHWAIIGDSAPEPVAVTGEVGSRMAYTIGCADPFPVDGPEPNIELIEVSGMYGGGVWKRGLVTLNPPRAVRSADHEKARLEAERRLASDAKRGIIHGYAGFGRRVAGDPA